MDEATKAAAQKLVGAAEASRQATQELQQRTRDETNARSAALQLWGNRVPTLINTAIHNFNQAGIGLTFRIQPLTPPRGTRRAVPVADSMQIALTLNQEASRLGTLMFKFNHMTGQISAAPLSAGENDVLAIIHVQEVTHHTWFESMLEAYVKRLSDSR